MIQSVHKCIQISLFIYSPTLFTCSLRNCDWTTTTLAKNIRGGLVYLPFYY